MLCYAGVAHGGSGSRGARCLCPGGPVPRGVCLLPPSLPSSHSRACPGRARLQLTRSRPPATTRHPAGRRNPNTCPRASLLTGDPSTHLSRAAAGAEAAPPETNMATCQCPAPGLQLPACPGNQHGHLQPLAPGLQLPACPGAPVPAV